ncbi:MAG: Permease of the drug/metabolite transporter (DMT) superfamily, partial [uncultured Thermomicrobiales bacterium]
DDSADTDHCDNNRAARRVRDERDDLAAVARALRDLGRLVLLHQGRGRRFRAADDRARARPDRRPHPPLRDPGTRSADALDRCRLATVHRDEPAQQPYSLQPDRLGRNAYRQRAGRNPRRDRPDLHDRARPRPDGGRTSHPGPGRRRRARPARRDRHHRRRPPRDRQRQRAGASRDPRSRRLLCVLGHLRPSSQGHATPDRRDRADDLGQHHPPANRAPDRAALGERDSAPRFGRRGRRPGDALHRARLPPLLPDPGLVRRQQRLAGDLPDSRQLADPRRALPRRGNRPPPSARDGPDRRGDDRDRQPACPALEGTARAGPTRAGGTGNAHLM